MTVKILEGSPAPLDAQFLDFFLKGNLSLEKSGRRKPYDWFPDQGWQDLMRLVELGQKRMGADGKMHPFARWVGGRAGARPGLGSVRGAWASVATDRAGCQHSWHDSCHSAHSGRTAPGP